MLDAARPAPRPRRRPAPVPADGVDDAAAGGAGRDQREPRGAAGAFEEGDGFGAEDVGVPGEFEEGDGGVEGGGRDASLILTPSRHRVFPGRCLD